MTGHEVQSGHRRFEQVVAAVIVANTGLLVWGLVSESELADRLETACLVFFVAELVVRLHRQSWRVLPFLARPWQSFDTAVVVLAFLPSLGVGVTLLRVARLARLVHVGRHVTHLRLFRLWRPGKLRVRAARIGALIAAVSFPATAHADVGQDICTQLDLGYTPDQIAAQLHSGDPRYNESTSARTVWTAIIEQGKQ